ncbi:MAG: MSHA biogenesis protein MshI [Phenylobacterium sp.]|jgi:MSHA biogenesis protein MshI
MANKTRVNLYILSLRPVKEVLSLNMMVISWVVTAVLLTATAMVLNNNLAQLSGNLTASRTALTDKQAMVKLLEEEHKNRKASIRLTEELNQLSKELQGKRILSQHLKGQVVPVEQRYSAVMLDMARFHNDQLWISEMRFDELGVSLRGYALNALAVPEWMNKLQQSPFFVGKEFAVLNLEDQDDEVIVFEINSVAMDINAVESQLNSQAGPTPEQLQAAQEALQ